MIADGQRAAGQGAVWKRRLPERLPRGVEAAQLAAVGGQQHALTDAARAPTQAAGQRLLAGAGEAGELEKIELARRIHPANQLPTLASGETIGSASSTSAAAARCAAGSATRLNG